LKVVFFLDSCIMPNLTKAYAIVADKLRRQIASGKLPPGAQLTAERELCAEFGVSRITIRHAVRLLAEEGLLQRRHGSGTYVKPNPTQRIPLMIDYTGSMRDHAPRLERRVLAWEWREASEEVAATLDVAVGALTLFAERIDRRDGSVVACDQAHIAGGFTQRVTREDLAHVDFIEIWTKQAGFRVTSCRQRVEAVAADAVVARKLGLKAGAPVLKSTEVYCGDRDQPAGLFVSFYHPEHICIACRYSWKEFA
jgi:GntR family transcriptional regulator